MSGIDHLCLLSFLGQFQVLLKAGNSSVRSLEMIVDYTTDPNTRAYLEGVVRDLKSGLSLEKAFFGRKHPFPRALVKHIKFPVDMDHEMAESVKALEDGVELKAFQAVKLPGVNQMTVLTAVGLTVVLVVLMFIVPMFQSMYADYGRALPVLTRAAMMLGSSVRIYWYLWIVLAGGGVWLLHRATLGSYFSPAGFRYAFALMLSRIKSGAKPDQAVKWAADSLNDSRLATQFHAVARKAAGGDDVAEAFREIPGFPPFVADLLALGEARGDLVGPLEDIVEEFSWRLTRKKEIVLPIWEAVFGIGFILLIAGLVVSMYLPIFSLASSVG